MELGVSYVNRILHLVTRMIQHVTRIFLHSF